MPAARALAILTLVLAMLGTAGCRSAGEAGQFFGAVLGTAAAVMIESHDDAYFEYEHHQHHGHHCR